MSSRLLAIGLLISTAPAFAQTPFTPATSPREDYSFDIGWKFFKEDAARAENAQDPAFNDSAWQTVSTPHTFNDIDSYRTLISHGGGDRGAWKGTAWYRKTFRLPASATGKRVFLEFEGIRQAGEIFLNGKPVGLYENGVTPYGLDITDTAKFTGDNLLAVHVDNRTTYQEKATNTTYEWNTNDFNPDHGGINRHVYLHLTGPVYQTFPLYYGLKTTGIYIYPSNINRAAKSADITIESEVKNASADHATVSLSAFIVDRDGVVRAKFTGESGVDMVAGEQSTLDRTGTLADAHFWSPDDPYLYSVYTTLSIDNKVVDTRTTTTGFRKAEFKGGTGAGGVFINDQFVYLKGFAQRSANDWAALGGAYPNWMHDLTAKLVRDDHANYIRWMHVAPQPVDVAACDRFGIVQVVPAGDKERDVTGRQWEQRLEAMADTIVYFRNSPSILFWESGNTVVTPAHTQQMVDLRKKWDPHGGRVMGSRGNDDAATNTATTPIAEFYGVMIGQDPRTDRLGPTEMFRGYSTQRRDRAPLIETEDFRDEGARRFWDDFSPPYFGFKKGDQDTYNWNSETFALAAAGRYYDYMQNIISNSDPAHAKWSGYASIYFSDSNADGRQQSSEVCRVSGKVDSMRLPKEIYFTHRVMQNPAPDVHVLGHWTYPAGTKKTLYVIANTQAVELLLNGKSLGKSTQPVNLRFGSADQLGKILGAAPSPSGYIFQFPDIGFQEGTLTAIASNNGKEVARHELVTAGPAKRLKLTPVTAPGGLRADGADVALFDVEVVDDQGRRCPTDDARVDFTCTGPAIWRGGYNSGKINSTNNTYLNTECGINRVAIRATTNPGPITLTATREGLMPATVTIQSALVQVIMQGLSSPAFANLAAGQ